MNDSNETQNNTSDNIDKSKYATKEDIAELFAIIEANERKKR